MGFLDRFRRRPPAPAGLTAERANEIVRAYGRVLQTAAPGPGCYADESKLPYSKAQIREALLAAMAITADASTRNALEVAYTELASWQPNVGPNGVGVSRADLTTAGEADDVDAMAARVVAAFAAADDAGFQAIRDAAEAERKRLLDELRGRA